MQTDITLLNRRKASSGRFVAVENTSTSCRLTTISLKLLDRGISGTNSRDTDVIQKWLCVKTARWMAALSQFHRKKALIPANSGRRIHSKLFDGLSVLE